MEIKATLSSNYRWRLGLIGFAILGFAAWFLYDGYVAYPAFNEQFAAYQQIKKDHPNDWDEAWQKVAAENNWPATIPDKMEPHSSASIATQKGIGALCIVVSLLFLSAFARWHFKWVKADDEGVYASGGKAAKWDQITSIDESRWKTKGIAVVHFNADGRSGRILLDDWKYAREETDAIYDHVTRQVAIARGDSLPNEAASSEADPATSTDEAEEEARQTAEQPAD